MIRATTLEVDLLPLELETLELALDPSGTHMAFPGDRGPGSETTSTTLWTSKSIGLVCCQRGKHRRFTKAKEECH